MTESEIVEFDKQVSEFLQLKSDIKTLTEKSESLKKSIVKMMGKMRFVSTNKYKAKLTSATKSTLLKTEVIKKFEELSKMFNITLELDDNYYKFTTYDNFIAGVFEDGDNVLMENEVKRLAELEKEKEKKEPKPEVKESSTIDLDDIKL